VVLRSTRPPNKEMKLTSGERIGRSQLDPSVGPTWRWSEALSFFRPGRMKFLRYETSALGVRVYADTAVVSGRVRRSRERAGQMVEDDWRFTKVYVRTGESWRVVAYHASEAGP
jgi:hypothetical protein